MSTIPIIVICYNNYRYVDNMINQLVSLLSTPDIRIFNNNSNEQNTLDYLSATTYPVVNSSSVPDQNTWEAYMYDLMPDVFAVTSSTVLFNQSMPNTFIDDLISIGNQYQSRKTGLALRVDDQVLMYQYSFKDYGYDGTGTIYESQTQYWSAMIPSNTYEIFSSPIDNTFCVHNKNYNNQDIRVAGNYTCRVMTWYIDISNINPPLTISRYHRYLANADPNTYQPIRFFELQYLADQNINVVTKRNYDFLVQFDGSTDDTFWRDTYPTNWEETFFNTLDTYLNASKQYLDIGGWIGDTALYASRKSSMVVSVEADVRGIAKFNSFVTNNYLKSDIYIEQNAIGSKTNGTDYYSLTDSRTYTTDVGNTVTVNTISFTDLISKYNLSNLSMIGVNINGSEEYILQDAYDYSTNNRVPLYVTFYYSTWENKDITRFAFLTSTQQTDITTSVTSILFNG